MKTNDFYYELPSQYIAQTPIEPRDASKLLVYHRATKTIEHRNFRHLPDYLSKGDALVINRSKVRMARIRANKIPTGGRFEILLLKKYDGNSWEVLVGGKGLKEGKEFILIEGTHGKVIKVLEGAKRIVKFEKPIDQVIEHFGEIPLPPYIHSTLRNPDRYQTIYAKELGSAAAPTAGLHFTDELIETLETKGVKITSVSLHIGLDTFLPVTERDPEKHLIHQEWCKLSEETAIVLNETHARGKKIVAVGTTSVRCLETAIEFKNGKYLFYPYEGMTGLYILPGYTFRLVDAIITNFHLPKSTLIMMIASFVGLRELLTIYKLAMELSYRFYSFGDAMLIL